MEKVKPLSDLESKIKAEINLDSASFAVVFKDVTTGEEILINEKENFHAASTMKTPVLIELHKQASEGKFSLSDSIEIRNTFLSIVDGSPYSLNPQDDSEQQLYSRLGEKESISTLAYYMIIRSSNLATNMLIEVVKANKVMETMRSLNANDIKVRRGVEDNKAYQAGLNNTTTAYDLMLLFYKMAKGELINKEASDSMINVLLDQEFREIIPARLPESTKVAHKTGSITGIQHDSGIVILPDGRRYVLILLSRFNPMDEKKAISSMANISHLIYNYMMNNDKK